MAKLLVIDDESNIRMMLRLTLTHAGHTVETAADGFEGLEKYGTGAGYDLALLDQRMPGMEGVEVLAEMRRRNGDARVILMTAFGTFDLAQAALAAGATEFLRKPFTTETLRSAVSAALSPSPTPAVIADDPLCAAEAAAVNGFRIRPAGDAATDKKGEWTATFAVQAADAPERMCRVTLPPYLAELVRTHADRDDMPGGARFWQALCGEALANHLWQNAELPASGALRVEDLTSGLTHWLDAVLTERR